MPLTWTGLLRRPGRLVPASPRPLPELAPACAYRRPRLFLGLVAGLLCVSYLLMVNPYWHVTPDSGIYLALAQNLAAGKGYLFNGVPHAKYPPGAPFFFSLLLRVSRRFLWLNLAECLVMLTGLAVLYLALREVTSRPNATLLLLLTGVLFWVHEFATTLKSEAVFFLFSNLSVLCLLRLNRSCDRRGRALWMAALCVSWGAAFMCRVGAAFWILPFAATLLFERRAEHPLRRRVADTALIVAVIVAASLLYVHWSHQTAASAWALRAAAVPGSKAGASGAYTYYFGVPRLLRRTAMLSRWPLLLLFPMWEPMTRPLLGGMPATAGHWLAALVVLLGAWKALRSGHVFLASSVLFVLPFAAAGPGMRTTHGRYINCIAPFLIILLLLGLGTIGEFARKRIHAALNSRTLVTAGILAVLLPNLLLFVGDVVVQRHPRFYQVFRGGVYSELTAIVKWLGEHDVGGAVGVHHVHAGGLVPCMTGAFGVRFPTDVEAGEPDFERQVADFARDAGLRYVVTFDSRQPWPVWNVPPNRLGGPAPSGPHWQLWEYSAEEDTLRPVEVPPAPRWPTALPEPAGVSGSGSG